MVRSNVNHARGAFERIIDNGQWTIREYWSNISTGAQVTRLQRSLAIEEHYPPKVQRKIWPRINGGGLNEMVKAKSNRDASKTQR